MKSVLLFLFLLTNLVIFSNPTTIVLGHEENNFPWVFPYEKGKDGCDGIDVEFIKILEKKLKISIKLVIYPWSRCLSEMKDGKIDGVFPSSYKKDREEMGLYPYTADKKVDESKYIHISGYSLYIMADSKIEFDGTNFKNLDGKIGAQRTFSIIPELKKIGVEVDESTMDPVLLFKMLENGRIKAATIQTARGDDILKNNDNFNKKMIKYPTDKGIFSQKPYFIQISHQLVSKYPDFSKLFYSTIEEIRNSKEFKNIEIDFYKRISTN